MKQWKVINKIKNQKSKIKNLEIVEILLANRGLKTKKEIKEFLSPLDPHDLTPVILGIDEKELTKAVKRITQAVKLGEKVIVYGDYDTDGVCATAILWEALDDLGAKALPYIPTREEGYGLKQEKIDQLKSEGVKLVVTVDHGIVANDQVKYAQEAGVDVVVTDHHIPGVNLPKALGIVHTTKLSGSGVAWFLSSHLVEKAGLDLVAIGTVADVMPLLGPNRAIVKYGLEDVRKTDRPGLLMLYQTAGIQKEKIGTYEMGYIIGPRLNAAGRMEDPMESLRLICTKNTQRAALLATKIDQQNRQRQLLTEQMTAHARALWLAQDSKGKLIFVSHESYEEGLVGLMAGKLTEEFFRPTIVVAKREVYSRASARSIHGFNIIEAIRTCADILGPHGGHALAAGFTAETTRLEELRTRLIQLAEEQLNEEKLTPILQIDLELGLSDLDLALWEKLSQFGPFGFGNPEPVFLTRGVAVESARLVGNGSQHLKLRIASSDSEDSFEVIGFGLGHLFPDLATGEKIDLVYNLIFDEWNGTRRLQLKAKDIRLSQGRE